MNKQVLIPTHINLDVADEYLKDGACRGIWNTNNGSDEEGLQGNVVNVKGNTKLTWAYASVGDIILNSFADKKNKFIYSWVYRVSGAHYMLRINTVLNTVLAVVWNCPDLELTPTTIIKNPYIIDDNLLYWSDGGYPKKLNLTKAYNTTQGIVGQPANMYYSVIDKQVLSRAKYVPNDAAIISYGQDSAVKANLFRGVLFQHSYRWIYDDNEKTTIAPISKVALPQGDELSDGTFIVDTTANNYQNILVETGSREVRTIELLARELNTGVIYLIDRIQKYDEDGAILIASNTTYNYSFYNNKAVEVVDQVEIVKLFNNVPLTCGSDSIIEGNRSVFGDVTVGFDNIDLDVTVNSYRQALPDLKMESVFTNFGLTVGGPPIPIPAALRPMIFEPNTESYNIVFPLQSSGSVGTEFVFTFIFGSYIKSYHIVTILSDYSLSASEFDEAICLRFRDAYNLDPIFFTAPLLCTVVYVLGDWVVVLQPLGSLIPIPSGSLTASYTNASNNIKFKSIKGGQWFELGFEYMDDAGRKTAVQGDDNCRVYVPHVTDWPQPTTLAESNYLVYTINHKAPSFATKYRLLMYTNVGYNLRIHIKTIAHTGNYIEIDINESITDMITANPKVNIGAYVWTKGDRIRFVARKDGANIFTPMPYLDYEIEKQDSTSNHIFVPYFDYAYYQLGVYSLVEIYTPLKSLQNKVYLETSETFDVLAGGYHQGVAQNQTAGQPAIGYINQFLTQTTQAHEVNNNFVRMRYTGISGVNYVVEDDNYSDYYTSNAHDVGLPNIINVDAKQRRIETGLIYTGKYFEYTRINNLSTVDSNLMVLNREYGAITSLEVVGDTLKAICVKKNVSIYTGRTEKLDALGNTQLILTDSILGNQRSPEDDMGCIDYGSIEKHDRYLYYLDRINARIVRDAANGGKDISAGVSSLIKTICTAMDADPLAYCVSAFDEQHDRLIMQFNWGVVPQLNISLHSVTITWSEKQEIWKEFLEWDKLGTLGVHVGMNAMCAIDRKLYSFIGNEIYEQYTNPKYNFIFGQQKTMKIAHVLNDNPHKNKIALNMAIETDNNKYLSATPDKNWSASSINVKASGYNTTGMNTIVNAMKFIMKEGVLYSEIGNDINTPMAGSDKFKLLNGRPIRGKSINIIIENKADFRVVLKSIIAGYIPSERSGQ